MEELLERGLGFLELGLGFGMAGLIVARRLVAIIFEAAIAHLRRRCPVDDAYASDAEKRSADRGSPPAAAQGRWSSHSECLDTSAASPGGHEGARLGGALEQYLGPEVWFVE